MCNHQNGFESIAEFLNIIHLGNLRVVASKDIDPCTEVVMDYFIQRSCFHASGYCACRKSPTWKLTQDSWFTLLNCVVCASFVLSGIQEKPYSRELCVQCSSCYRGIHQDCLTKDDCDVLDTEGVCCSVCTASKKKRALTFASNSQRYPPGPQHLIKNIPIQNSLKDLCSPSIPVKRAKLPNHFMKPSAVEKNNLKKLKRLSEKEPLKKSFHRNKLQKNNPTLVTVIRRQTLSWTLKWVALLDVAGTNFKFI